MPHGYIELCSRCPRSFLFTVVANVGPGGASRSLAVAYRQGNDDNSQSFLSRVDHFVADTLALIEIFSDPANRAPLEAERSLAEGWYRDEVDCSERPSVPDTPQPRFLVPEGYYWGRQMQPQPQLPWHDVTPSEFPFTITCLLLGLLRDNGDGNAKATKNNRTRPGDVQLQPLSTVFRGDCTEYGLVVLDISDLDSGVKYGIVAFPVRYMGEVVYYGFDWDPVEDLPTAKEPDVVLGPRPRVLLSIHQWLRKYFNFDHLKNDLSVLSPNDMPLVDAAALDFIWPPELDHQAGAKDKARSPSQGVISRIFESFWPSKSAPGSKDGSTTRTPSDMVGYTILDEPPQNAPVYMDSAKDAWTATAPHVTTSHDPAPNAQIDRAIDDLLVLTQQPIEPPLEKAAIGNLQMLAKFREQLWQQLEEAPDRLGPSKIRSHVLRVAYAGRSHLNWVALRNLPPSVIAAAVASDELRGASAISLCVDQLKLEGEGDLGDLAAALAHSTALK
ncbi:hypothetical protein BDV12DRAFT_140247 [Aspergillus spectabilis]